MRILYILLILSLVSCVDIHTDYPENEYFGFSKENITKVSEQSLPISIFIDGVSMSPEYDDIYIKAIDKENKVEKYVYYKWIAMPSEMFQNYFNTLLIKSNLFGKGVYTYKKRTIPNYILNLDVIQFDAYEENVEVLINFTLIRFDELSSENVLIMQKSISKTIERENGRARSIPVAFNVAINEISQEFINEISTLLK